MSTGERFLNITSKRLLGTTDFGERFLEYMRMRADETNQHTYDSQAFLTGTIAMSADGTNKFKLTKSGSSVIGCDALGNFLDLDLTTRTGIQFENTSAVVYSVGAKHCNHPYGIQINPRTGAPEYVSYEDQVGEQAEPDAVIDNGGTITFTVNSVTEAGVSAAGRIVKVYKKVLAQGGLTEAIAIEDRTVSYSGGLNQITTTGTLGQTVVSTTASDYEVVVLGPSVKRFVDLSATSGYTFIGTVTGAGYGFPPTVFDHSDQRSISYSWTTVLLDGLPQHFLPAANATYNLGSPTFQWANIYTQNLVFTSHFLPNTDNTQNLGSPTFRWAALFLSATAYVHTLLPETDATYNLGAFAGQWNDLYLHGVAYIDTLSLSTDPGEGVFSDLYPTTNGSKSVGNKNYKWLNGYYAGVVSTSKLEVDLPGIPGEGVASDLRPSADGTRHLGSASYRWSSISLSGPVLTHQLQFDGLANDGVSSDMAPVNGGFYDFGEPTRRWLNGYFDNIDAALDVTVTGTIIAGTIRDLNLTDAAGQGVISDIVPGTGVAYNIGSAARQFDYGYFRRLSVQGGAANQGVVSDLIPETASTYNLGDATHRWSSLYAGVVYVNTTLELQETASRGVASNLSPNTNGTRNLGHVSWMWNNAYISGTANIITLSTSTGAGNGCASSFVPTTGNSYDLGNATYQWRDLYIDGTANVDTLSLESTAGLGVDSDFVPASGSSYSLGNATYTWVDIRSDNATITDANVDTLVLSSTLGEGSGNHIVPTADDAYDLGNTARTWRELVVKDIRFDTLGGGRGFLTTIYPSDDDTHNLGSTTRQWQNLYIDGIAYIDTLSLSGTGGEGVSSHIMPATDNLYNLGFPSYHWNNLYVANISLIEPGPTTLGGFITDCFSDSNNAHDLGRSGFQWKDLYVTGSTYVDDLFVSTAVGEGLVSSLFPASDDNINIGSSSRHYNYIYCNYVRYDINSQLFDNHDDLALIDAYEPNGKVVSIKKGGKTREVQQGKAETIPWPMLADKNLMTGEYFMDGGDSALFLVGAIKQLHAKHNAEVGELKKIIDDLADQVKEIKAQA